MTNLFPGFNESIEAQIKTRIAALHQRRGMCGSHIKNSLNFHLHVESLREYHDIDMLLCYEQYLLKETQREKEKQEARQFAQAEAREEEHIQVDQA